MVHFDSRWVSNLFNSRGRLDFEMAVGKASYLQQTWLAQPEWGPSREGRQEAKAFQEEAGNWPSYFDGTLDFIFPSGQAPPPPHERISVPRTSSLGSSHFFPYFFSFFPSFLSVFTPKGCSLHQAISVIKMQTSMLIVLSQWVFFVLSQWVQGGVAKRKVRGKAIWLLCAAPYRVWLGHMGKSVGGLWGLKVWRCSSGLSFSWGFLPKAHSSRPLVSTAVLSPQP